MATIRVMEGGASDVAPWIERLARVGYVAKAVLYGTIGAFATMAAFRAGGRLTDTRGAMSSLVDAPLGAPLLSMMAVGLFGYAVWRVVEGIADPEGRGSDLKGLALRASFIARGIAHGALGVSALALAFGWSSGAGGGGDTGQEAARAAFRVPGGTWLVFGVAAGVMAYGLYQLYRAFAAKLSKRLDLAHASHETGRWVIGLSRFGIAARGIVFIAAGWTTILAARRHDASDTGDIRQAFDVIQDWGRWPLAAVALGLVAYGVYELLNARYRRIRAR